jgi:hypothetical protein
MQVLRNCGFTPELEARDGERHCQRARSRRKRAGLLSAAGKLAQYRLTLFLAFESEVPAPADNGLMSEFRLRLFDRLRRKLPASHALFGIRADDLAQSSPHFD